MAQEKPLSGTFDGRVIQRVSQEQVQGQPTIVLQGLPAILVQRLPVLVVQELPAILVQQPEPYLIAHYDVTRTEAMKRVEMKKLKEEIIQGIEEKGSQRACQATVLAL